MNQRTITYPKLKATYSIFALVTVLSICFVPYIPFTPKLSIRLEDILLPFVVIALFPVWKEFKMIYFKVLFCWCLWAILTMAVNNGLTKTNDYFEIYKLIKYVVYTILFLEVFKTRQSIFGVIAIIFGVLVLFNLFHYFNVFNFNKLVMPTYCPNKMQLQYFGRNSLGGIATKRILGTMGNPNINGILFLFFNSYFLTFFSRYKWHLAKFLFFISFAMLLFTQSRTSLIAFVVYFSVFVIIQKMEWRLLLKMLIVLFVCAWFVQLADNLSLSYFSDASFDPEINSSIRGRLETWKFLWEMILDKPLFGHGINKNFFYQNDIYSENEYLLNIWRYGFPGLVFYLFMVIGLLILNKLKLRTLTTDSYQLWFLMIAISVLVSGFTNNALSNPMLLIAFSVTAGAFLSTMNKDQSRTIRNEIKK